MTTGFRGLSLPRYLLIAVGAAAIAVAGLLAVQLVATPPPAPDLARTKESAAGLYTVSLTPEVEPVPQGVLHVWLLSVFTPDGAPVEDAQISVDGGMPAHGHGLPTAPQVTAHRGEGLYRVEGVRFNMGGRWVLRFTVSSPRGEDEVAFDIVL